MLERFKIDLSKQVKQGTYRYEFYKDKHLSECITDDLSIRWYWKDEFLNILRKAGFAEAEVLTGSSLYEEGHRYVFKASKYISGLEMAHLTTCCSLSGYPPRTSAVTRAFVGRCGSNTFPHPSSVSTLAFDVAYTQ